MPVNIRKMTDEEYASFYRASVESHAAELSEELDISFEDAYEKALSEIDGMLYDGLNTKDNDLMSIVADGRSVGYIWTLYEESCGESRAFVCDLAVCKTERRKGYGEKALLLSEDRAKERGCKVTVLFVNDKNHAAISLYEKCSYKTLRQAGNGRYMIKRLI